MVKVVASHESIKRQIEDNVRNPFDAFNEYLWNALDANARNIHINVKTGSDHVKILEVVDDGDGINYDDLGEELFLKFNTSLKSAERNQSLPHGKRGFGRFSFVKFAERANWDTIYHDKKANKNFQYRITIEKHSLDDFEPTEKKETTNSTMTKVSFAFSTSNNKSLITAKNKDILYQLKENINLEFCWIVELLGVNILINDKKIDYKHLIEKSSSEEIEIKNEKFKLKFINWKQSLKNQSSRYYLINSKGEEVFVDTTTLNKKSDEFYHSLYVTSEYFDHFELLKTRYEKTYKELIKYTDEYLKKKRKPFIQKFSAAKIKEFEEKKLFPKFDKFEEQAKKPLYETVVREVIEFAPSLVSSKSSNDNQRRILLQLIYRLLDDEHSRKILYEILEVLVDEDNRDQLEELNEKLRRYGLKNILGTIKLIEDRRETIKRLRDMIYQKEYYFLESDLQRVIENHFWIFGEEYHLMLGAEEDDFTKLRNIYCEKVLKLKKEEYENDSVSKRQVDLFVCGIMPEGRLKRNLIVEIKKPDLPLKKEHYRQIDDYKDIINNTPDFNSESRNQWDFILLYKDISKEHVKNFDEIITNKTTGLSHDNQKNMRIFVIKWADLLDEVEFRLKFLKDSLEKRKGKFAPKKLETKEQFLQKFENSAKKQ